MIKCVASDMDGTLLTSGQEITKENREAIKKARDMGVEFVVVTGRSYLEAKFVLEEAGIQCPVICVNGGEVRSEEGVAIASNPLSIEKAREIAERLEKSDVYFEVYTNKGTFTDSYDQAVTIMSDILLTANPEADVEKVLAAAEERFHKGLVKKVDTYRPLFDGDGAEILKFLAFSLDQSMLAEAKEELSAIPGIAISSSGAENIEITSIDAQKGIALEAFVKNRGISLEETMALGDNYNDISMFKKVGISVAMGNAPDDIKSVCSHVTSTNEENGVAKAIEKIITI
ncbi:hydrolase [Bacillus sp. FJAT-18017]|uniref:Cof-type HAD-IIB family hydrolase n=1 Tax=Bacillus sp. FJAT-18017 TaxID=1705566 RepID=UPI0006AD933D|nr:Cof-type HAD-IIB family hydrolase [Bacillus sp. FJAT-18017]ALC88629.1 hydrolase [Bacillus sp. FJAT-18017]